MRLVGLTGGIGSGKSTFADALRALGAPVLDADRLAREAVRPGSPWLDAVVREFGPGSLLPGGELDRKGMAARVFSDAAARARLEAVVHPAIRAAVAAETARLAAEGRDLAFYDVPLLFERGLDREVDCVVVIWVPPAVQLARLMARDGLTRPEAQVRLDAQIPIDEKARRADVVVSNDGDIASLRARAGPLLQALRAGLSRRLPNQPPARY